MVAGVVVDVRDRGVEADPAEQLPQIHRRLSTDAAQFIGQQQVQPPAAIGGEAAFGHLQPAAAGQQQQAVLHPWLVPGVGRCRELGQPEGVVGLHGCLGAGDAHRRAGPANQRLHLL